MKTYVYLALIALLFVAARTAPVPEEDDSNLKDVPKVTAKEATDVLKEPFDGDERSIVPKFIPQLTKIFRDGIGEGFIERSSGLLDTFRGAISSSRDALQKGGRQFVDLFQNRSKDEDDE